MPATAISLVPLPAHFKGFHGEFLLKSGCCLRDEGHTGAGAFLRSELRALCGIEFADFSDTADPGITLMLVPGTMGPEAYTLSVRPEGIAICAAAEAGLFYGVQSLLQLAPPELFDAFVTREAWPFSCAEIKDAPRFAYRGLLVDVARHFFDLPFLKKQIEAMARHKLNVLHLHLTDDTGWRLESSAFPRLTQAGAVSTPYFTAEAVVELVAFAAARHITIIPEVDMPGHGGAAAKAYPEFYDGHITLNPGNPETFRFAEAVFKETAQLFPGAYLHFGGDEVRETRWADRADVEQFRRERNLSNDLAIEGALDRELAGIIEGLGRTPIAWDEAAVHNMPTSTVIMWWKSERTDRLDLALRLGHRVILSPNEYYYFDYAQFIGEPGAPWEGNKNGPVTLEAVYQHDPVPLGAQAQVLGLQAAIWTEFIRTEGYFEFMLYPRLCAFAETCWSAPELKSFPDFELRLAHNDLRLQASGINARRIGVNAIGNNVPYLTH